MTAHNDRFHWHPQSYVTEPQGNLVQVIRNSWWYTNDNGEVAIYGKNSPQCNTNPVLVDRLIASIPGAVDKVFIPIAFVPYYEDYYHG